MKTLFFILLSQLCHAQMYLNVKLSRIPLNYKAVKLDTVQRVMLVFEDENIGYFDGFDTLALVKLKDLESVTIHVDELHNNQVYFVRRQVFRKGEFVIFITPLKPHKRKLCAIVLRSLYASR